MDLSPHRTVRACVLQRARSTQRAARAAARTTARAPGFARLWLCKPVLALLAYFQVAGVSDAQFKRGFRRSGKARGEQSLELSRAQQKNKPRPLSLFRFASPRHPPPNATHQSLYHDDDASSSVALCPVCCLLKRGKEWCWQYPDGAGDNVCLFSARELGGKEMWGIDCLWLVLSFDGVSLMVLDNSRWRRRWRERPASPSGRTQSTPSADHSRRHLSSSVGG